MKSEGPKKKPKRPLSKQPRDATDEPAAPHPHPIPISETNSSSEIKTPLPIPPILLEGDPDSATASGGPGQRYALGPKPPHPLSAGSDEPGELPEAYGTRNLFLTARDPHWLYAHWDLTRDQLQECNSLSADRHLVVRVYKETIAGKPVRETHVHPESRNWLISVEEAGAKYLAELGYYSRETRQWVSISSSAETVTPPEGMSDDLSVRFETMPTDLQFEHLVRSIKSAIAEEAPLVQAFQQLRGGDFTELRKQQAVPGTHWTPDQERALAELVSMEADRRVWMGSPELAELIRAAAAKFSAPGSWSAAVSSFSSPLGGMQAKKTFWFNINAELILYGATEPNATVTIGGRVIRLRPDGTFSYRFALPDGEYRLPVAASSPDGSDTRVAELSFTRGTQYHGEVGKHPQDPGLAKPVAQGVA